MASSTKKQEYYFGDYGDDCEDVGGTGTSGALSDFADDGDFGYDENQKHYLDEYWSYNAQKLETYFPCIIETVSFKITLV